MEYNGKLRDDFIKEIFEKIQISEIKSTYYRLIVILLSDGISLDDILNIKTQDVLDGVLCIDSHLNDFKEYVCGKENSRIREFLFSGYNSSKSKGR